MGPVFVKHLVMFNERGGGYKKKIFLSLSLQPSKVIAISCLARLVRMLARSPSFPKNRQFHYLKAFKSPAVLLAL